MGLSINWDTCLFQDFCVCKITLHCLRVSQVGDHSLVPCTCPCVPGSVVVRTWVHNRDHSLVPCTCP